MADLCDRARHGSDQHLCYIPAITCTTLFIAVAVSGLGPAGAYTGLGLQNSLQPYSQPILIDTDGTFPLNDVASSGQRYQIVVTQQPSPVSTTYPRVYCTVTNVGGSER